MATNRIPSITRWPSDLAETMSRAERDMDFVEVMMGLGFYSPELQKISIQAATMYVQAEIGLDKLN
jgi:hypothetical protein